MPKGNQFEHDFRTCIILDDTEFLAETLPDEGFRLFKRLTDGFDHQTQATEDIVSAIAEKGLLDPSRQWARDANSRMSDFNKL